MSIVGKRYASSQMQHIWSAETKVLKERELWIAVMRAQAKLGLDIPAEVIAAYEGVKTKIDLAWEQIEHTKNLNIPFECVHFDGFYGRDTKLLKKCDESKIHFMADIPSSHTVSLQPFEMKIPNKIACKYKIIF